MWAKSTIGEKRIISVNVGRSVTIGYRRKPDQSVNFGFRWKPDYIGECRFLRSYENAGSIWGWKRSANFGSIGDCRIRPTKTGLYLWKLVPPVKAGDGRQKSRFNLNIHSIGMWSENVGSIGEYRIQPTKIRLYWSISVCLFKPEMVGKMSI